jgi:hypothetical protein
MAQSILEVTYKSVYGDLNAAYQTENADARETFFLSYWDFANTLTPEQHRQLLTMYLDSMTTQETRSTIEDADQWQAFETAFFMFINAELVVDEKAVEFSHRLKDKLVIAAAEFMKEEYAAYCALPENNPALPLDEWLLSNTDLLESALNNFDGDITVPDQIIDSLLRAETEEEDTSNN